MENEDLPPLSELQRSLDSMRQLQRAGVGSILLMTLGIAVVGASVIYSFTRLRPLEQQIADKKAELAKLESTGQMASDRNQQVRRANEAAEKNLQRISVETQAALTKLEQIRRTLPPGPARDSIQAAIRDVHDTADALKKTASDLDIAIEQPHAGLEALIKGLFDDQASVRLDAYDDLLTHHSDDAGLVPELLNFARNHARNQNGIYNTLVVLGQLNKIQTKTHLSEIRDFAADAKSTGGPKTQTRASDLLGHLGSL